MHPKNIVRYEAFVNSLAGYKCSVAAHTKPLQCTLKGIGEAVNFRIIARACLSAQSCEPSIEVQSRTKLRGKESYCVRANDAFLILRCKRFEDRDPFTNIIERDS